MTNEQIIEKLIDQINNDMQIFIAVLSIVIAIAAFLQWRISDKQIHKMQMAIREANDKAEKLAKMNKILIKNSALAIARNQFLIGFPDWRSDIEFFEYIKDKILVAEPSLIKYSKTQIANDFALYIHETCRIKETFSPVDYMIYDQDNPSSQLAYIIGVKENSIYEVIDNLEDRETKRKLFSDFQEFMDFWNNN